MPLSDLVRKSTWEDQKSTFTNPALVGPPLLEFSVYKKFSGTRRRTDARQGTIDQDPEFMAFLEGLANPPPMRQSIDVEDPNDAVKTEPKATTTALVEYLKEKKANRAKDVAGKGAKAGKGRTGAKDDEATVSKKKGKDAVVVDKGKVKILTKKAAATEQAATAAKKAGGGQTTPASVAATATVPTTSADATAIDGPKNRRAGIAAAARLLQRDLGLSPGSAHRRARHDAAKADVNAKDATPAPSKEITSGSTDATPAAAASRASADLPTSAAGKERSNGQTASKSQGNRKNRGGRNADKGREATNETASAVQPKAPNPPVILKKQNKGETDQKSVDALPAEQATALNAANGNVGKPGAKEKGASQQAPQKKSPHVSPDATRAFVKNVNASQGMNDASLRQALQTFGAITLVDIDKRKGFAYVDFADHAGLVKAVTASPMQVGQATVQIVERKDKKSGGGPGANDGTSVNGDKEKAKEKVKEKEKPPGGGRGRRGRGGGGGKAAGRPSVGASKEASVSTGG